jgi:CxxC motif-containing protein (DUF1111 family)
LVVTRAYGEASRTNGREACRGGSRARGCNVKTANRQPSATVASDDRQTFTDAGGILRMPVVKSMKEVTTTD